MRQVLLIVLIGCMLVFWGVSYAQKPTGGGGKKEVPEAGPEQFQSTVESITTESVGDAVDVDTDVEVPEVDLEAPEVPEVALPPGIENQAEIPGEGLHRGWEQGQHKGWENTQDPAPDPAPAPTPEPAAEVAPLPTPEPEPIPIPEPVLEEEELDEE